MGSPSTADTGASATYPVPRDLDLAKAIGQCITQFGVGQFDFQFRLGPVYFSVQSAINVVRDGVVIGGWREDSWPSPEFLKVLNVEATPFEVPDDRTIITRFTNEVEMHLIADSEQYECMTIGIDGEQRGWII